MSVSREQAGQYTALLKKLADERLVRALIFGRVAIQGLGDDLDLIVEVPEEAFVKFASNCIGALDGFHPILKALMSSSAYWNYHSPVEARRNYAFAAIGIETEESRRQLREIILDKDIDILCLPVGWINPGYADELLKKNFGNTGKDVDIFENIKQSMLPV